MKIIYIETKFKILAIFSMLCTLISCTETERIVDNPNLTTQSNDFTQGYICDGKTLFSFNNFQDMQNEYNGLSHDYFNGDEEEQILIDFEDENGFYSLRRKDEEMDEGIIPDEPNFDSFDYTSDDILETFLNEDGMVVIDDFLYLWDDGCVIHKIPYSGCGSYEKMLEFGSFLKTYNGSQGDGEAMLEYRNQDHIEEVNICNDYRYDFENISENPDVKIDYSIEPESILKASNCGFSAHISYDILAHDPDSGRVSVKFEASTIAPVGSTPLYSFLIDNSDSFDSIEITNASIPSVINSSWAINGGNNFVYPGKWFVVDIVYDITSGWAPFLNVSLLSSVSALSGDSCSSTDNLGVNLACPIGISKESINAANGAWFFTLEGLESYQGSYAITWNFGDGSNSVTTTNVNGINHQFPTPCLTQYFTVTATIEASNLCDNTAQSTTVPAGDSCKRQKMSEKYKTPQKVDGKKAKMKIKIKNRPGIFGGGTKIKHKFRYRKTGTKTITTSGQVFLASGNNCNQEGINTLLSDVSQSGKRKAKQKMVSGNIYMIDLNTPYSVTFRHSNGFSHTLTYIGTCSQ